MWFYVSQVLIPHQRAYAAETGTPRGNLSDLYPRWLGSRELLLHGRNPYSPDVTGKIQEGYYGRRLDPKRPEDPKDQQAFAYPVYVVVLLAPTVGLPFATVQHVFVWVLLACTVVSVFWWLRAVRWRPGWAATLAIPILTLGSYPCIQGVKLQQLSLVVAAILAASAALLVSGRLLPAGVLLALATIKPQLVAPLSLFLLLWSLADWRKRRAFVLGFALTILLLLIAARVLLPSWLEDFWHAMAAYRRYAGGQSMLDVLAGNVLGKIMALAVLAVIVGLTLKFRREEQNSNRFSLMLAFVLAATLVVIPMFAIYNQLLLLPAILVALRDGPKLSSRRGLFRLAGVTAFAFIGWPWFAAVGIAIASPFLSRARLQQAWPVPLWTSLGIPLACLVLLAPLLAEAWVRADSGQSPPALAPEDGPR
jgi:hypothetical protein